MKFPNTSLILLRVISSIGGEVFLRTLSQNFPLTTQNIVVSIFGIGICRFLLMVMKIFSKKTKAKDLPVTDPPGF